MKHLHRRLQKLETAIRGSENWSMRLLAFADRARRKLSSADRELLNEAEAVLDGMPHSLMSETHEAVWQRCGGCFRSGGRGNGISVRPDRGRLEALIRGLCRRRTCLHTALTN